MSLTQKSGKKGCFAKVSTCPCETVGIIPAAGWATRFAPLPFSKELYPIGFSRKDRHHTIRPKVVCQYLLERLRSAGIRKAYVVLRDGKWDIPAYFKDGYALDMDLAYLMMRLPYGVPYTLDQAYPFVKDAVVALGFPDIIFQPEDAFSRLLTKQADTNADIVLGLAPIEDPQYWDMVDLTGDGRIRRIHIKQPGIDLPYGWFIAVWTPSFTGFMHEYLAELQALEEGNLAGGSARQEKELCVGDVIQAAVDSEMHTETVVFHQGSCLDAGTPEGIIRAVEMAKKL